MINGHMYVWSWRGRGLWSDAYLIWRSSTSFALFIRLVEIMDNKWLRLTWWRTAPTGGVEQIEEGEKSNNHKKREENNPKASKFTERGGNVERRPPKKPGQRYKSVLWRLWLWQLIGLCQSIGHRLPAVIGISGLCSSFVYIQYGVLDEYVLIMYKVGSCDLLFLKDGYAADKLWIPSSPLERM